jgi:hypothetical protein
VYSGKTMHYTSYDGDHRFMPRVDECPLGACGIFRTLYVGKAAIARRSPRANASRSRGAAG